MRVAVLLVGHRFTVLAPRTINLAASLDKFIGVPFAIFADPITGVVGALPENKTDGSLVETDDYVRVGGDAARRIPHVVKFEGRVKTTETSGSGRSRRQTAQGNASPEGT